MIYEFITPSDPITFVAENDTVAWFVAVFIGNGKAGCHREDGHDLNTMLFLYLENVYEAKIKEHVGDINSFMDEHAKEIADACLSFGYTTVTDRKQHDLIIDLLQDSPEKLERFRREHDDLKRSSLSEWVNYAWEVGRNIRNKLNEKEQKSC
jgi:hypothetical protein